MTIQNKNCTKKKKEYNIVKFQGAFDIFLKKQRQMEYDTVTTNTRGEEQKKGGFPTSLVFAVKIKSHY